MEKKPYYKPLMAVDFNLPNGYISNCEVVGTKALLIFEDSDFYTTIYWDKQNYGTCDADEKYITIQPFPLHYIWM